MKKNAFLSTAEDHLKLEVFKKSLIVLMAVCFMSCSSNEPPQSSHFFRSLESGGDDFSSPLKQQIRHDLCEQFLWANDIRTDREYTEYPYRKEPIVHHTENALPIYEEQIITLSYYDIIDQAYILAYRFEWSREQNGPFFTVYTNYLSDDEPSYCFPLSTYPSVWKDGVIYPTLVQAVEAGVLPEKVITAEYWNPLWRGWVPKEDVSNSQEESV